MMAKRAETCSKAFNFKHLGLNNKTKCELNTIEEGNKIDREQTNTTRC
jgi:hypothetical protein